MYALCGHAACRGTRRSCRSCARASTTLAAPRSRSWQQLPRRASRASSTASPQSRCQAPSSRHQQLAYLGEGGRKHRPEEPGGGRPRPVFPHIARIWTNSGPPPMTHLSVEEPDFEDPKWQGEAARDLSFPIELGFGRTRVRYRHAHTIERGGAVFRAPELAVRGLARPVPDLAVGLRRCTWCGWHRSSSKPDPFEAEPGQFSGRPPSLQAWSPCCRSPPLRVPNRAPRNAPAKTRRSLVHLLPGSFVLPLSLVYRLGASSAGAAVRQCPRHTGCITRAACASCWRPSSSFQASFSFSVADLSSPPGTRIGL